MKVIDKSVNNCWISVHLFHSEPYEPLLINGIQPFIQTLLEKKEIQQFFFVRYKERGPHIRLRIKLMDETIHKKVTEQLKEYFESYFQHFPSPPILPSGEDDLPNNSIHFIKYVPELERYGGEDAMEISETLFFYSSQIVLRIISDAKWDIATAFGAALQLHLALLNSFNYSRHDARTLFSLLLLPSIKIRNPIANIEDVIAQYELRIRNFDSQALYYCDYFWSKILSQNIIDDLNLREWVKSIKSLARDFENLNLITPPNMEFLQQLPKSAPILSSHIHMINNRLGIPVGEESYINFLLQKSLT